MRVLFLLADAIALRFGRSARGVRSLPFSRFLATTRDGLAFCARLAVYPALAVIATKPLV